MSLRKEILIVLLIATLGGTAVYFIADFFLSQPGQQAPIKPL